VADVPTVNGKDLVSPEQLTYVLIALVVAGVALGLLVVIAVFARRRDARSSGQVNRFAPAQAAAPVQQPQAAPGPSQPAPFPAPVAPLSSAADESLGAPASIPGLGAQRGAAGADRDLFGTRDGADSVQGVRAADVASETGRRFTVGNRHHEPGADAAIAGFLALEPGRVPKEGPVPDPFIDPLTGLDTLLAWERTLAAENARYVRYRRPVTVVVAEIDGLSRLVDRFGAEPARRVLPAVGDAMRRHARRTDQVAHVGGGRFLVLLPETDEVAAINYVERVRMACERWLESGAVALHLAIGWASPTQVGEVDTAMRVAEERMYAERRRVARPDPAGAEPAY
jgi:diguanylate cyclase (GGDEF)-like protein